MKGINGFTLKMIAIMAMLINHLGSGFAFLLIPYSYNMYLVTLWVGRLTFPIMAFLLVEGFRYTRNKRKYLGRLSLFWLISIYPFYLLFDSLDRNFELRDLVNNIFFTLMMGLILLVICEKKPGVILEVISVGTFFLLTYFSDWGGMGILLIYGFYKFNHECIQKTVPIIYTGGIFTSKLYKLYSSNSWASPKSLIFTAWGVLLTIPLLLLYNGERGYVSRFTTYFFYVFYPLHLMIIVMIRHYVFPIN